MGNNLSSMFIIIQIPKCGSGQCPFFKKFCTSSGHFLARPGDAQNLPIKTRPGCGSVHYKYFTKSGHFRGRPGDCPKSPQNCRAAQEKNLLGRTGARLWKSGSKSDKTVPAIIAQFGHEFRIFQSCRFP